MANDSKFNSVIFDSVLAANNSALNIMEGLASHNSAIAKVEGFAGIASFNWANYKDAFAPQILTEKFLSDYVCRLTQTSVLAQSALANIDISKIWVTFGVADEIKASFNSRFEDFSISYKNLFKSFEVSDTSLFKLPPTVSELPTVEFFNSVELLETTVEEENQDEYRDERTNVRDKIKESANDSIIVQLKEINSDWITMLEGAKQAFNSTNPDKTRHCITSLRELVREIMHFLSPDDQIKSWSVSPDDFANKRPTRRARLRFITRNINHGAFTDFVEKDIEAILAAINIFQVGTHVANSKLTEAQISALIARVESTILFLFSIANHKE